MKPEDVSNKLVLAFMGGVADVGKYADIHTDAIRSGIAAVAEQIAQAEREKCAALVDCGCAHKADVLAVRDENSGDRWRACGQSPCGALEARAIRARGGEG